MGVLGIILLVIFIIASLLLVLMVIIQDSDSDSLGGVFAGGSGSAFGSRSTNVVVRFTYALGAIFFVCAFSLALINKSSLGNVEKAAVQSQSKDTTSSEWWNAKPQSSAPQSLQGAADGTTATAPAEAVPVPLPATGKK
jgi:preprotein translocase subunit SecG